MDLSTQDNLVITHSKKILNTPWIQKVEYEDLLILISDIGVKK